MFSLEAKGVQLDADGELQLEINRESALKFLALTLAKIKKDGCSKLRFDCTSWDGCLLVKNEYETTWWELLPLPDEALAPYHRLLANELFGSPRRLLVQLASGWSSYEPTIVCQVEDDHSLHEWEASLKPTAIWFRLIHSNAT